MYKVPQKQFEEILVKAIDSLPDKYAKGLENVVITIEDTPNSRQIKQQKLSPHQSLLGLYEGIPMTSKGNGYSGALPDKITIFQRPIENISTSLEEVIEQVNHTLWHEVAHFYGLDHIDIAKIDKN